MLDLLYINEYFVISMVLMWFLIQHLVEQKTKSTPYQYIVAMIGVMVFFNCPVPESTENRMTNQVINAIQSNEKIVLTNTQLAITSMNKSSSLKAKELFAIKRAFAKDFEATFRSQKGVFNMSIKEHTNVPKLKMVFDVK